MRLAVASIAIGPGYRAIADVTFPSILAYASRIGAKFIPLMHPSGMHVLTHFEKLGLYSLLGEYDRVVYLDCDVLVRRDCPDLFSMVRDDEFGAYDESALANDGQKAAHRRVMSEAYQAYGVPAPEELLPFYNTGVMVASRSHRDVFAQPAKEVAKEYAEQPWLNVRLRQLGVKMFPLPCCMNRMYYIDPVVREHRTKSYMVHYAGQPNVTKLAMDDMAAWRSMMAKVPEMIPDRTAMLDYLGLEGKKCVEVGVFEGGFASEILLRNPQKLWLIDPWVSQPDDIYPGDYSNASQSSFEDMHARVVSRFAGDSRVQVVRSFSLDASECFLDNELDFVYVDAIHTLESSLMDVATWYHKVKPGGIIAGHDYGGDFQGNDYPGIKRAVDSFCKISGEPLAFLTTERWGSWGIRKSCPRLVGQS